MLNFTNEGGYLYHYRCLKNIVGLWMIQFIRRNMNSAFSFAQLEQMARDASGSHSVVDVNDERFLAPGSMIDAAKQVCGETGQAVPGTTGELMHCVKALPPAMRTRYGSWRSRQTGHM